MLSTFGVLGFGFFNLMRPLWRLTVIIVVVKKKHLNFHGLRFLSVHFTLRREQVNAFSVSQSASVWKC